MRKMLISFLISISYLSLAPTTQASQSQLHGPELVLENPEQVAGQILDLFESSSEVYSVGDGLALALYIIRTFNVAGSYDLSGEDLRALVKSFETLVGESLREEVHFIINGIKLIKFREIDGLPTAQFFTVDPSGIVYPINEIRENSSVKEIKNLVISNGASISFDRVNGPGDRKRLRDFTLDKLTIFPLPAGWFDAFNQIHPKVEANVESYILAKEQVPEGPHPLRLGFKGFTLNVKTSTVFKDMALAFTGGYSLPSIGVGGLRGEGVEPLPSFLLELKSGVLKIRVSLDQ